MKPEAQRIAIAKACGYLNPREINPGSFVASAGMNSQGKYWGTHGIPDYLNDLNAMHEAEKVFDQAIMSVDYVQELRAVLQQANLDSTWDFHATAPQRAEAFLKTLNLWTNDN